MHHIKEARGVPSPVLVWMMWLGAFPAGALAHEVPVSSPYRKCLVGKYLEWMQLSFIQSNLYSVTVASFDDSFLKQLPWSLPNSDFFLFPSFFYTY